MTLPVHLPMIDSGSVTNLSQSAVRPCFGRGAVWLVGEAVKRAVSLSLQIFWQSIKPVNSTSRQKLRFGFFFDTSVSMEATDVILFWIEYLLEISKNVFLWNSIVVRIDHERKPKNTHVEWSKPQHKHWHAFVSKPWHSDVEQLPKYK